MISSIHHIATLELPELEPYKTLRRPFEHLEQGIFVAEGEKVVLRLLASPLAVQSILLSQDWFEEHRIVIEENTNTIEVFIGTKKLGKNCIICSTDIYDASVCFWYDHGNYKLGFLDLVHRINTVCFYGRIDISD
ncbi:MAG: hypothetical protein WCG34_12440 [Leptolinea sp.]